MANSFQATKTSLSFHSMPKAELHAHLNGSLSSHTVSKLMELKKSPGSPGLKTCLPPTTLSFPNHDNSSRTLEECFQLFKTIHELTDTVEGIYLATVDVIKDFAEDNVKYLELRTTPRPIHGAIETYIETVLRAIDDCRVSVPSILVKLLLSIDRSKELEIARKVVDLTILYGQRRSDVIVGLDVSGNMANSNIIGFFPYIEKIRTAGLKITIHTAEVSNDIETESILRLLPNRIGHGTFINSPHLIELLKTSGIPVEVCLTSNVVCRTVPSYKDHHLKDFMQQDIPFLICTDDKGVFDTTLSKEYSIACETFGLSKEEMFKISLRSIDYAFLGEAEKEKLRSEWENWKRENL